MDDTIRRSLDIDETTPMEARTIDITTTGRRSGEPRRIETVFYRWDGDIYLCGIPQPTTRAWLLNLAAHPEFRFHLKHGVSADLAARAEVIEDPERRRGPITQIHAEFDRRHGPDSPYPKFPLADWLANAPLARVSFED